ncbi:MAG: pilin [Candidatus Pacebacteria bacterium]|nr:pilin [Candidatus Paceibacterota bacterium]
MKSTTIFFPAAIAAAFVPALAFAETSSSVTNLTSLFQLALSFINSIAVPIIFAIAFVVFLIGIFRYFIQGAGNAEKTAEGRQFLLWSLIGFFVMVSVWGLVNLFLGTLNLNSAQPSIPTFSNTTSGSSSSGSSSTGTSGSTATSGNTSGCQAGSDNGCAAIGTGTGNGTPGAICTPSSSNCTGGSYCDSSLDQCACPDGTTLSTDGTSCI